MKKILVIIILLFLAQLSKAQEFSIEAVNSYTIITSPTARAWFNLSAVGLKTIIPSYGLELFYKNKANSTVSYSLGTSLGSKKLISVPFYINYNWNLPILSSIGLGLNYFHRDDNEMSRKEPPVINDIQLCARLKKDFTITPEFQAGISANLAYGIGEHSTIGYSHGGSYMFNFHYILYATNLSLKYNF